MGFTQARLMAFEYIKEENEQQELLKDFIVLAKEGARAIIEASKDLKDLEELSEQVEKDWLRVSYKHKHIKLKDKTDTKLDEVLSLKEKAYGISEEQIKENRIYEKQCAPFSYAKRNKKSNFLNITSSIFSTIFEGFPREAGTFANVRNLEEGRFAKAIRKSRESINLSHFKAPFDPIKEETYQERVEADRQKEEERKKLTRETIRNEQNLRRIVANETIAAQKTRSNKIQENNDEQNNDEQNSDKNNSGRESISSI